MEVQKHNANHQHQREGHARAVLLRDAHYCRRSGIRNWCSTVTDEVKLLQVCIGSRRLNQKQQRLRRIPQHCQRRIPRRRPSVSKEGIIAPITTWANTSWCNDKKKHLTPWPCHRSLLRHPLPFEDSIVLFWSRNSKDFWRTLKTKEALHGDRIHAIHWYLIYRKMSLNRMLSVLMIYLLKRKHDTIKYIRKQCIQ